MRKVSSIIYIAVIVVMIAAMGITALTFSSSEANRNVDNDYYITEYNVSYTHIGDRTFDVEENITAVFRVYQKHGIIRDLAANSGEVYSDVNVLNASFDVKMEDINFVSIYIGDEDTTLAINKPYTYSIRYKFKVPEGKNRDEFAINVLGGGWATSIADFSCTISYPSSPEKINLASDNASGTQDGRTYSVTAQNVKPFQAITVYATFNGGTLAAFAPETAEIIAVVVAFVALAIIVALCLVIPKITPVATVNFYPPEGMDPLYAGTLIDGTAHNEDVTSLLYYWADLGCINIDFSDEKDPLIILKKGLPDGTPEYQHILFNKIFENRVEVNVSALSNTLAVTAQEVKAQAAACTPAPFSAKSRYGAIAATVIAAIIYVATLIGRALNVGIFFPLAFIAVLAPACIYITGDFAARNRLKFSKKKRTLLFAAQIAETAAFSIAAFFIVPQTFLLNYIDLLLALACCGIAVAAPYLLRYDHFYCESVGPLLGFRNFIEVAEKDRLEKMIDENPAYYYKVLPYAQVMGVSDVWESKFKGIDLQPPAWASGYNYTLFDYMLFTALMRNTWRGVSKAFVPPPSRSGRSGGGGFRIGGGFGGGGGRSW